MNNPRNHYEFSASVKSALLIFSILLCVLVITIPFAIFLLVRRSNARLTFTDDGFEAVGLGGKSRWRYSELERLGLLSITVGGVGAGVSLGQKLNGGATAVNLCGKTKAGKTRKLMISRFDDYEEILERLRAASGLELEAVGMGAFGPKWPERVAPPGSGRTSTSAS